jgi:hypothetical protein
MTTMFYLHEDECGMVDVLPAENLERSGEIAQKARAFGEEHFDGVGWTEIYVIPEPEHDLSARRISLAELRALIGSRMPEAQHVQSGYSTYREDLENCFAFGEPYSGAGAFYGVLESDIITRLSILPCDASNEDGVALFTLILNTLGEKYNLILADWWHNTIVELSDKEAITRHLCRWHQ